VRILSIFGTRPEAIKMAPVLKAFAANNKVESLVCVTGQHRCMLDQVLDFFNIKPHYDLNIMKENQGLADLTSAMLLGITEIITRERPDRVLVHGDTTTALAATLAAFYKQVPVGHVEAGLRTGNIYLPFPEEANRILADNIADMLFAPTKLAKQNLLSEGIAESNIFVTGNTVIDALFYTSTKLEQDKSLQSKVARNFPFPTKNKKLILVTGHRRESFGEGLKQICEALGNISNRGDVDVVYPVHLNPNVKEPVTEILSEFPNIHLLQPLDYPSFVYAMKQAYIIVSDSGGIQEEAPSLGKPVLVMRTSTERPEVVTAGAVKLVGTSTSTIIKEIHKLLDDTRTYNGMTKTKNPFGDGFAANRIVKEILSNG